MSFDHKPQTESKLKSRTRSKMKHEIAMPSLIQEPVQPEKKPPCGVQEAQKKVQELFELLKKYPNSYLLNQPLSIVHPLYHQLKHDFQTLSMLELQFRIGNKFLNTQ